MQTSVQLVKEKVVILIEANYLQSWYQNVDQTAFYLNLEFENYQNIVIPHVTCVQRTIWMRAYIDGLDVMLAV